MSHLFPVNDFDKVSQKPMNLPPEKIGEEEKELFSRNNHKRDRENQDEIDKKVKKLIKNKDFLLALGLIKATEKNKDDLAKLGLSEFIAHALLKNEILNVANTILGFEGSSDEEGIEAPKTDDFGDMLSYLVKKITAHKKRLQAVSKKKNYGKAYPLLYKSSGFLVHYCNEIINMKKKLANKKHSLKKLDKDSLSMFYSKEDK